MAVCQVFHPPESLYYERVGELDESWLSGNLVYNLDIITFVADIWDSRWNLAPFFYDDCFGDGLIVVNNCYIRIDYQVNTILYDNSVSPFSCLSGTTAAGCYHLEKAGLRSAINGALEAATKRAKELSSL